MMDGIPNFNVKNYRHEAAARARFGFAILLTTGILLAWSACRADEAFRPISLQSKVTRVQPMTGLVLWATSPRNQTDAIQLEFSYMKFSDIVKERGQYDWRMLDQLLAGVSSRRHQAIVRFYYMYPGRQTTVPSYIKALSDYHEIEGKSEGRATSFEDWTHPELRRFTLEFFEKLAERYDQDRRLAFLEVGFGLWSEYHIYDGPMQLGKTFPDRAFQTEFMTRMDRAFRKTPWLISKDAADGSRSPFPSNRRLLDLNFGLFDDSFLCEQHARENEPDWVFFGRERWTRSPAGGEISYYTKRDQSMALAPSGPHGNPFEKEAARFHITFMIADGQPGYQPMDRIRAAGMACGYRFRVLGFEANAFQSRVTITNNGVAPLYHDAFLAVNQTRSTRSLKGLLPGETRTDSIAAGGADPVLTIECDRLVPGQSIQYEADVRVSTQ